MEKNIIKKILSPSELALFWNSFEKSYTKNMEYIMHPTYITMCNLAKLNNTDLWKNKNILEMGCGSGIGLEYLSNLVKNQNINIIANDISSNMINSTYERLNYNMTIKQNFEIMKADNDKKLDLINQKNTINLAECNNENLDFLDNTPIDLIISNLTLHLVTNPDIMIREASRLLKEGSCFFSLIGRQENSPYFSLIPKTLKKFGIPLPQVRSFFHLSNIDELKPLFLDNGFSTFNYMYTFCPFNIYNFEDFEFMLHSPGNKDILDKIDPQLKTEIYTDLSNSIKKIIDENHEFFGTEIIIVMARKIL